MTSSITPASGARTSMVTLSVSIWNRTSSTATASPGRFAMACYGALCRPHSWVSATGSMLQQRSSPLESFLGPRADPCIFVPVMLSPMEPTSTLTPNRLLSMNPRLASLPVPCHCVALSKGASPASAAPSSVCGAKGLGRLAATATQFRDPRRVCCSSILGTLIPDDCVEGRCSPVLAMICRALSSPSEWSHPQLVHLFAAVQAYLVEKGTLYVSTARLQRSDLRRRGMRHAARASG